MKRREFFKSSLFSLSIPSFIFGKSKISRNKNNPLIITTWNYPKANEVLDRVFFLGCSPTITDKMPFSAPA